VLRCVREAERQIASNDALNKEYLPVQGLEDFLSLTSQAPSARAAAAARCVGGRPACFCPELHSK